MLPYQAVAMDYAGYQRQSNPGSHMSSMGSLGMPAAGPFAHSWLVPTQDLCAVSYNKMQNQHQPVGVLHSQQQPLEPGLVNITNIF